ncbi:hypothetical protein AB0L13_45095 [Saccharopolyspora shandongensis]|uniref:hypothetical protein n=1 Tax=Saccharopolyspora shandongensis TaxID=418495 RepID=UPI003417744A
MALAAAHHRARAAHDSSRSKNLRVYGTALWEAQHEELVSAAANVDGVKVAKLGGYQLPVISGNALFPLRYADRAGVPVAEACLPLPVSEQRERLFGAHAPEVEPPTPFLDDSWAELDLPVGYEVFPQLGEGTELVVVAYACNLEAGVLHVEWGRAEHVGNGELRWGEHTPLPLSTPHRAAESELSVIGAHTAEQRWDAVNEPDLPLSLRKPSDEKLDVPPQTEHHPDEPYFQENDQD